MKYKTRKEADDFYNAECCVSVIVCSFEITERGHNEMGTLSPLALRQSRKYIGRRSWLQIGFRLQPNYVFDEVTKFF